MRHRAVLAVALPSAIAVAAVTAVVSSAASASTAVPVPAPTHVPTDPCDGGPGPQQVCESLGDVGLSRFCSASAGVGANHYPFAPGDPTGWWEFQVISNHSCPNRSNDLVRTTGTMQATFNGGLVGPFTCFGMGSCTTDSGVYMSYGPRAYAVVVHMVTSTIDDASATMTNREVMTYP